VTIQKKQLYVIWEFRNQLLLGMANKLVVMSFQSELVQLKIKHQISAVGFSWIWDLRRCQI